MKNKLSDLNNHLFAQIERLSDEDLGKDPDRLKAEIDRSKAIANISRNVIDNARIVLDAAKMHNNNDIRDIPKMIGSDDKET